MMNETTNTGQSNSNIQYLTQAIQSEHVLNSVKPCIKLLGVDNKCFFKVLVDWVFDCSRTDIINLFSPLF